MVAKEEHNLDRLRAWSKDATSILAGLKSAAALILCLSAGSLFAETVSVKTFGRGATAAAAVEAGKKQAIKDAYETVFPGQNSSALPGTENSSRLITGFHIVGTEKIGSGLYEAELEAEVFVSRAAGGAHRTRVAFVADPTSDGTLAERIIEETKGRLAQVASLIVVEDARGPAEQLLARIRAHNAGTAAEQSKKKDVDQFDLLFVLSSQSRKSESKAAGIDEIRTRIAVIDAATEELRSVATVKSALAVVPIDAKGGSAKDISSRIARVVSDFSRQRDMTDSSNLITVPTGSVRLKLGQKVSIFRSAQSESGLSTRSKEIATGEVVSLSMASARIYADHPLRQEGRYVVKPVFDGTSHGIISDSDW